MGLIKPMERKPKYSFLREIKRIDDRQLAPTNGDGRMVRRKDLRSKSRKQNPE